MRNVAAIKKKFGANAFKRWGALGTSPVLKAWSEGRVTIHSKPVRKKPKR